MDKFSKEEELLYEIIFSNQTIFIIDLSDYVSDIYQYTDFTKNIKSIIRKSGIKIIVDKIIVDSITAIWELKLNK